MKKEIEDCILKPCKSCGGEAMLYYAPLVNPSMFWVRCKDCAAKSKTVYTSVAKLGKMEAIAAWNNGRCNEVYKL